MDKDLYNHPWKHVIIDDFFPKKLFLEIKDNSEKIRELSKKYFDPKCQTRAAVYSSFSGTEQDEMFVKERLKTMPEYLLFGDNYSMLKLDLLPEFQNGFSDSDIKDIRWFWELLKKIHSHMEERIYDFLELLLELSPNSDLPAEFHTAFQLQQAGLRYLNHDESYLKLLSVIIFIDPEHNYGTWLYDTQRQNYDSPTKKIEWKPNRAFIFSGVKGKTWHSFSADPSEKSRIGVGFFLKKHA